MKQEYEKLIESYREQELLAGYSQRTIYCNICLLKQFFKYIEDNGIELYEVNYIKAQGFQGWLKEKGKQEKGNYTNASICNFIEACKSFYRYLRKEKLVETNPFKCIRKIRVNQKIPRKVPREKEMNELLELLEGFNREKDIWKSIRQYKIHVAAEVMYSTGLRISELSRIKKKDIDFSKGTIRVLGKGNKERTVFLNEYAGEVLRIYVETMRDLIFSDSYTRNTSLFGVTGVRLQIYMNEMLKEKTKELKLNHMTSHIFRHSFGFHFLRNGCELRYIQKLLGHDSLRSTEIYTKVDKEDLKRILDEYHPRKWKRLV